MAVRARLIRVLDDPLLAGLGLAFPLFVGWQLVNHYVLMPYLLSDGDPLGMEYYHYLAFLAEIILALVILIFASRALAAKNRQIEELSRQKDSLTDALVHDLRQPLTAVLVGLEGLIGDPGLPAGSKELAGIARLGGQELLGMVNDLLDIGKLEAGHPVLQRQPIPLEGPLRRGAALLAEIAHARGQRLSVEVEPGLPEVSGDEERLRRVVTNLVGNAIKFTPDGGEIAVRAGLGERPSEVVMSVADTGPGIPKQHRERIFDKFAALDHSFTDRTSTGLGLSFCKMIAEAHGGRIWVESEPGRGTTFFVALPAGTGRAAEG